MFFYNSEHILLFFLGVCLITAIVFLTVISVKLAIALKNERKRWNNINDYIGDVTRTVNSVRYGNLSKLI